MTKRILAAAITTGIILTQSVSAFAGDNTIGSRYKANFEGVKARAIAETVVQPSTIVTYNGHSFGTDSKDSNSIDTDVDIKYEDVEAGVIVSTVVCPSTIVDIDIPLAGDFIPNIGYNKK